MVGGGRLVPWTTTVNRSEEVFLFKGGGGAQTEIKTMQRKGCCPAKSALRLKPFSLASPKHISEHLLEVLIV